MYNMTEAWRVMHGSLPIKDWDGKLYCTETDGAMSFRSNETHGFMAAYSFTLVTQGSLTFRYNDAEMTIRPNDLYIYSPGMSVTVLAATDDYHGICLMADEQATFEAPNVRDLVHLAYKPIVQLHEPRVTLPREDARRLAGKMREIIAYLHSNHIYKSHILQMLYGVFLLDLQNVQERAVAHRQTPPRIEELFMGFIRLLPRHFAAQHGIAFYASQLNISPVYLSRIVRQVSGRTVVDYINQMLLTEASFLLRTTSLSVGQIADRLHFADTASFSKFFTRMQGQSPINYRRM